MEIYRCKYLEECDFSHRTHLVPFVLQYGHFEKLRILNADSAKGQITLEHFDVVCGEFLGVVRFVDDLRHADHFALVIADRHTEDQVRFVAGP